MKNLSEVNVTTELLEKVQECKTVDELMELAKETDVELTREEAEETLDELKRQLTDEEMDLVAGGDSNRACYIDACPSNECPGNCGGFCPP